MACFQQVPIDVSTTGLIGVEQWYAVHTRARHEKKVAATLQEKKIHTYLPVLSTVRRWSDRRMKVESPLFSCYAFVRIDGSAESRLKVLRTPGVLRIVSQGYEPLAIPQKEIDDIQLLLSRGVSCWEHPFLSDGQRVRVRGGIFDGVEGILASCNSDRKLVLSVSSIHRSIAIRLGDCEIEPVN